MASGKSLMSNELKLRLARELGFAEKIEGGYFGNVSSKECGRLVRQAIEHVERSFAQGRPAPRGGGAAR
ncbi:MAG: small, acid-soluble spore protein, alpha/beta type [Bacillota bacterium]|nr:small, acid-soluble spore protein, alpha/beta type [Bacillota bacterium]